MNPIQKALAQADAIAEQERQLLKQKYGVIGVITSVRRVGNTKNGNGRFSVIVDAQNIGEIVLKTAPDSSVAGSIDNGEFRTTPHKFTLNKWGMITHAEVI